MEKTIKELVEFAIETNVSLEGADLEGVKEWK